ncbi:MAG: HlyD family type I secretion periplasmic adaptor subunit [Sterolibacterium sp.]|nr:HlyD family type I secretion periplasmic adaptor subunit [Sterolibacterium sp.]
MNKHWKLDSLPTSLPLPSWMLRLRNALDRLLSRWIPRETKEELDWVGDADWAHIQQEPLRARFLLRWTGGILLALLIWAGLAKIDEVTRGSGKVTPSLQLQVIQAVDPGVVSEIAIKDGQPVEQGQLLMKIDQTRFLSSLQENQSQYVALQAKAARLRAIADNQPFTLPPEVEQEVPQIAAQERALYLSRRSELDTQLSMARQQLAQRNQELNEVQARNEQAKASYQLANQELNVTKPLVSKGAVSEVELLRLQRDVARFRGDVDEAAAQLVRVQASINEARHKVQDVELNFKNTASVELAETMAKISSLSAGSAALSDRVKHSNVVSPVKGTVKRLRINTVGGVVQPGTELLEVVPTEDTLLLEVRIQPKDVAFLRPGMKTMVRFTAYDFSIYGSLEGVVDHIGADTVTDDKGNSFYIVQVHTLKSSLGENLPLLPGMQAEVDILTGKKSILSYLLKPILRAHQRALTER